MKLGVLASHEGTTLQALIDACPVDLPSEIVAVISNNRNSGALRRARQALIPAHHLSTQTHPIPEMLDMAIADTLEQYGVDLVVLAGYMKRLGPLTLARFNARVLNVHPALLPKFGGQGMYGLRVHEAVLSAGERITGVSIHVVDAEYDSGPLIAQATVPVEPGDTPAILAARVQERERLLLVDVLKRIALGQSIVPK